MKTAEQILDNVMCCTIEEDAEDVKENYYYKHDDVVKAIEDAQKEADDQAIDLKALVNYFELNELETLIKNQSSSKIKQLEWKEDDLFTGIIVSEGFSLQFYEIKIIDNTLYIGDTEQSFKTIDEAKAAAQRDFEKRVKECLNI